MTILEELKMKWQEDRNKDSVSRTIDQAGFGKIIRSRVKKEKNAPMKYFWASFTLQLIVFALLCHVIVKYSGDPLIVLTGLLGIMVYIPFTWMFMKKFRKLAVTRPANDSSTSLQQYVRSHHDILREFYRFKVRYELLLIPLASVIGVFLVFHIYVPGGVAGHLSGALITLGITLLSCFLAILTENRKSFERPLANLQGVLDEFDDGKYSAPENNDK